MRLYGYISITDAEDYVWPRSSFDCLTEHDVRRMYIIDNKIDDSTRYVYDHARDAGVEEFVIAFRERVHNPNAPKPDLQRLERAKRITRRIALGNSPLSEWSGRAGGAQMYLNFAKEHEFEWCCPLIVSSLPALIQSPGWSLRQLFAETQTEIFCLCGYVFVGYENKIDVLYKGIKCQQANRMMPHQAYKMEWYSKELFTEWMAPLNINTGCHGQHGLDNDILTLAPEMGFKGFVSYVPFKLPKDVNDASTPRLCVDSKC